MALHTRSCNERTVSTPTELRTGDITTLALIVEGGLIAVAFGLGWLIGCPPLATISQPMGLGVTNGVAILIGLIATIPLLVFMLVIDRLPLPPLRNLSRIVDERVAPWFMNLSITEAFFIALLAGVGEELLFRGVLQQAPQAWGWSDPTIGLIAASLIFGVCHWVTRTYAILTVLIGFYLGFLLIITDNLLCPIVTHTAYDFLAILYIQRTRAAAMSSTAENTA